MDPDLPIYLIHSLILAPIQAIGHLLTVLKQQSERGAAFSAIADMACALSAVGCAQGFDGCLQPISVAIKEALTSRLKSKGQCPEALQVGESSSMGQVSSGMYMGDVLGLVEKGEKGGSKVQDAWWTGLDICPTIIIAHCKCFSLTLAMLTGFAED